MTLEEFEQTIPEPLRLNLPRTKELLTEFIRTQIHRAGLSKAVVGLSGGIDSALVVHLCVTALGPENVLAVMMPHRSSNPDSLADALKVVEETGCRHKTIEISPMTDAYIERCEIEDRLRRGNIFARQRMIILYDQSAAEGALVVGTSNKTEALLGYSTMHGDNAWGIGPILDLYKTQVRALSFYMGVNLKVIEKPPSADLWLGQTDEDELGVTYAEADRLLVELIDLDTAVEDLIKRGEPKNTINGLIERIRRNEFKRTAPACPIITSRQPANDWLDAGNWTV